MDAAFLKSFVQQMHLAHTTTQHSTELIAYVCAFELSECSAGEFFNDRDPSHWGCTGSATFFCQRRGHTRVVNTLRLAKFSHNRFICISADKHIQSRQKESSVFGDLAYSRLYWNSIFEWTTHRTIRHPTMYSNFERLFLQPSTSIIIWQAQIKVQLHIRIRPKSIIVQAYHSPRPKSTSNQTLTGPWSTLTTQPPPSKKVPFQ